MSDEPKTKNGDWQMPEPIFRSSEGRTPKSALHGEADEIDTAAPNPAEADTDEFLVDDGSPEEIETESPNAFDDDQVDSAEPPDASAAVPPQVYEEQPPGTYSATEPQKQAGGCAQTILMIVGTIALSVIALLIALVYLGFFYRPSDHTF